MARRRFTAPPQPTTTTPTKTPLPKGIVAHDLQWPKYDDTDGYPSYDDKTFQHEDRTFDLWLVSRFGWVIPTLAIARGGQRTYAVALGEGGADRVQRGAQVRCGMGPHVLAQHTVHVRASRRAALQPFLDLRREGAVDANVTRDRISSRRAQGSIERANGNHSWRWDV